MLQLFQVSPCPDIRGLQLANKVGILTIHLKRRRLFSSKFKQVSFQFLTLIVAQPPTCSRDSSSCVCLVLAERRALFSPITSLSRALRECWVALRDSESSALRRVRRSCEENHTFTTSCEGRIIPSQHLSI